MPIPSLSGVVLAGGRSTRMGRDKARLQVGGQPLWRRQVRLLEACGAQPVLLALRPRQRSLGAPGREIRDQVREAGPLGGLAAALETSTAEWLAVLAVDLPAMEPAWFRRLLKECRPGRGAVFLSSHGYEPLAAIYPREAAPAAARRLKRGRLALQGLVRELIGARQLAEVRLPRPFAAMAANWNAPADWPGRAAVRPRPEPAGAARRR